MLKAYKFGLNGNDDTDHVVQNDSPLQENDASSDNGEECFGLSSTWTLVDWCDNSDDSTAENNGIAKRLSCFAHSLQLAIRDGLKDTPYLSKSLSKCIKLAHRCHKSTKIADLLEDIGREINRSNNTRWNSEYLLVKSIIELGKGNIDSITDLIDIDEFKFNNNDFLILQEAVM